VVVGVVLGIEVVRLDPELALERRNDPLVLAVEPSSGSRSGTLKSPHCAANVRFTPCARRTVSRHAAE
jgi:hypothetical protein